MQLDSLRGSVEKWPVWPLEQSADLHALLECSGTWRILCMLRQACFSHRTSLRLCVCLQTYVLS